MIILNEQIVLKVKKCSEKGEMSKIFRQIRQLGEGRGSCQELGSHVSQEETTGSSILGGPLPS